MMNQAKAIKNINYGKQAEELAACYLKQLGHEIIERRYHSQYGEIDIIARRTNKNPNLNSNTNYTAISPEQELVFVEVKARSKSNGYQVFTPKQAERIYQTAEIYLSENPQYNQHDLRLDLIHICGQEIAEHIRGI